MITSTFISGTLRRGAVAGFLTIVLSHPLGAQDWKQFVGRWKLTMALSTPAAVDAQAAPAKAARAKAVKQALTDRAAKAAARGKTLPAARAEQPASAEPLGDQFLTVKVRGDTIFAIDSAIVVAGTIVAKVDTFVVNGKERAFRPTGGAVTALAQRPAAKQAIAKRAAAQTTPGAPGQRRAEATTPGQGFVAHDSVSLALGKRTLPVLTETEWYLSEDRKTLTIETKTTGAQGVTVPLTRTFTRSGS